MVKKQKSFADKAAGSKEIDAVYVKYVKSVRSEKTGQWRFNEQMVRTKKNEQLDVALKRMDEVANLSDIDLSEFEVAEAPVEEKVAEIADKTVDIPTVDAPVEESIEEPSAEQSSEEAEEDTTDEKE